MKDSEFRELIKRRFEDNGFRKISINSSFLVRSAEVSAKDRNGRTRFFKCELVSKWGKEQLRISEKKDNLGWIDELAAFDAIFDD